MEQKQHRHRWARLESQVLAEAVFQRRMCACGEEQLRRHSHLGLLETAWLRPAEALRRREWELLDA